MGCFMPTAAPAGTPLVAHVFIDGQNLCHAVEERFGRSVPDFDVVKLAGKACQFQRWQLGHIWFYTGIPARKQDPAQHDLWARKLARIGKLPDVTEYHRKLKYDSHGRAREKGIDVRLALDLVLGAVDQIYQAAVIFSEDQDLSEAVKKVTEIGRRQGRQIPLASAFPSPGAGKGYPIAGTQTVRIYKQTYLSCLEAPPPGP